MSMDRLEVRISITKLLLALTLIIVPLSIVGLVLTQRSDKSLDNAVGSHFKSIAQLYASQVTQFMRERLTDVGVLANNSTVVSAATGVAGVKGTIDVNASNLLRQHKSLDPRFHSMFVTNANGTVVASTQRPSQISYSQDANWQAVYNNGQGTTKISDILDDEITKASYVNIGVPVTDQGGQTVGVLNAAVNVTELLAPFKQEEVAGGARVVLVNDDGNIVSGPNADVFAHVKAPEFDFVRDALGSTAGAQNGWVMANVARGQSIVGFAGTGLKQHFPNFGWTVTVSQNEHQAAEPIRLLERFALGMVILALFMLTLLCVYYYLHNTQRYARFRDEEEVAAHPHSAPA